MFLGILTNQDKTKTLNRFIITIIVFMLVSQNFVSSVKASSYPVMVSSSGSVEAVPLQVDVNTPRRVLTLPDSVGKLAIAGGATLSLSRVAPDQHLRMFTSSDGGTTWNYTQNRNANPILDAGLNKGVFGFEGSPLSNRIAWVGSDEAVIGYTNNGGQSWVKLTDNLPGGFNVRHYMVMSQTNILKLWVAGGNELWAFTVSSSDGSLVSTDKFSLPANLSSNISSLAVNMSSQTQLFIGAGSNLLSFDSSLNNFQLSNHFQLEGQIEAITAFSNNIWLGLNNGNNSRLLAYNAFGSANWVEVSNTLEFDQQPGYPLFPIRQIAVLPNGGQRVILMSANDTGQTVVYFAQDGIHFHPLTSYNYKDPTSLVLRPDGSLLLGTNSSGLFSSDQNVPPLPSVTAEAPNPLFPQNNKPNADYYQETGHYLAEPFRSYWQQHGGLAQFGYPLTEVYNEINSDDGQIYQTQYFERARFEYHPEIADPQNQILLGLLGKQVTPDVHEKNSITIDQAPGGSQYFASTAHSLSGVFLNYWQSKGGLAVFGYPLTEPFQEVNPDDGKTYLVQYFERNRFEYHPENNDPNYQVLLGLLGKQIAATRQIFSSDIGLKAMSGQITIPWGEQGKVFDQVFHSPILNRDEPYRIYLPPGYYTDTTRRYPVLYMLHGYSGNRIEWFNYGLMNQADSLINQGKIVPMIIVLPTGDQEYWVDHANGGLKWGTYVAQDVVNFIDQNYRTKADRQDRAIGGLSMGGHGGLQIGMNFSNVFGIASGTSSTLRDQQSAPSFFGDATWFATHDPITLAQTLDLNVLKSLKLWIDVGADDKDWVGRNQILDDALTARGVPHEFHILPGGHTYDYWVADVPLLLNWYSSVFSK